MDTGADTYVYPRNKVREPANKNDYELIAANGKRIATYGTITVSLNLSLRRAFKWRFVVADVQTPTIGVDFLSHYGLFVDPQNKWLLDTITQLSTKGFAAIADVASIKTIDGDQDGHHHQRTTDQTAGANKCAELRQCPPFTSAKQELSKIEFETKIATARSLLLSLNVPGSREEVQLPMHLESETGSAVHKRDKR